MNIGSFAGFDTSRPSPPSPPVATTPWKYPSVLPFPLVFESPDGLLRGSKQRPPLLINLTSPSGQHRTRGGIYVSAADAELYGVDFRATKRLPKLFIKTLKMPWWITLLVKHGFHHNFWQSPGLWTSISSFKKPETVYRTVLDHSNPNPTSYWICFGSHWCNVPSELVLTLGSLR